MQSTHRPSSETGSERLARARTSLEADQPEEARQLCLEVLGGAPTDIAALGLLGQIELALNHDEEALRRFRTMVELEPADVSARKDLALALSQTGNLAAGEATLREALALQPRYLSAHYFLSLMKSYSAGDPDLAALEDLAADEDSLSDRETMQLGFALAKALDDVGDYARSFQFLLKANRIKRASMNYDLGVDLGFMDRVERIFDREQLERMAGRGRPTALPVLIVGMPRSGSTLVEQILAGHPAVGGAGERSVLAHVASSVALLGESGEPFPEGMTELPGEYLSQLGAGYARRLEQLAPGAARVTDKNLFNFAYLGLTRLITPQAHVIHCIRDPLDVCLSCFSLDFAHVRFSFDLAELGGFHRGYQRLMDHWRQVLPRGWVLDVRYEDLVDDLEGVARRMIDHCELEWDERCLDFQDADRNVRTASFAQVRRPLSRRSIGRWRRYEPYLGPLMQALSS